MSTEHAVDPSTLPDGTIVEKFNPDTGTTWPVYKDRGGYADHLGGVGTGKNASYDWRDQRIVAVLHRADECPPAETWRQVAPEEVREGWIVENREREWAVRGRVHRITDEGVFKDAADRWIYDPDEYADCSLWTNEPAPDPDAEAAQALAAAAAEPVEWARHVLDQLDSEWRLVRVEEDGDE